MLYVSIESIENENLHSFHFCSCCRACADMRRNSYTSKQKNEKVVMLHRGSFIATVQYDIYTDKEYRTCKMKFAGHM